MSLYHYQSKVPFQKRSQLSINSSASHEKKLSKYLRDSARKISFYRPYKNLPYALWPILDWSLVWEKKVELSMRRGYWQASKPFTFESSKAESKFISGFMLGHPSLQGEKGESWYLSREAIFATICVHGNIQFEKDLYYIEPAWTDERQDHMVPLVSTLTRHANPLVRYRVDEFLLQTCDACPCEHVAQSSGQSYKMVGRAEDILYVPHLFEKKLLPLYPDKIDLVMKQFPSIQNYQIVQQSTETWKLRLQTKSFFSVVVDVQKKFQSSLLAMQMKCPEILCEEINSIMQKEDRKIIKALM